MFNFEANTTYDDKAKLRFHNAARKALRQVAIALQLQPGEYDLRSNKAGPAVSGEITLHGESIYIQVSQSCMGPRCGILIRSCNGRRDYTGGHNNFMPLNALHTPSAIAALARKLMPESDHDAELAGINSVADLI